ncbi:QsdR family transcriptional regulator [Amycolatopsis sp. SID8362]|uniref:QsdR family transcriptional regulator n=1 Tax=Amycolatopsis sp. SID8362 TaxID=2690346 RepID=UPI00136D0BCF|nr:QsdR family transcriptional regulator [Amycolatopsis sp. SID8362]NBH03770.1 TetR/AcrR family transcriptional regulator [Amycolatopsis sp. SID8362]NED40470.1 TetR/AcrR family transcriptional regulator [Amycolatopsis sp. SID8362]
MSQEFERAREWFLSGRRVDMGELAEDQAISRATLHRRVGSRDRLLGEILWSLSSASIARLWPTCAGRGAAGVADFVSGYVRFANDSPPFRDFLRREPERALRLLTTRASVCQQRTTAKLAELLTGEVSAGRLVPPLPVPDLAYLLVRIGESFVYTDVITGDAPDAAKAHAAVTALLT